MYIATNELINKKSKNQKRYSQSTRRIDRQASPYQMRAALLPKKTGVGTPRATFSEERISAGMTEGKSERISKVEYSKGKGVARE